ncbi:NAD(P)/FAD-dependent oxidoreductase [Pelotomaculum isophthalicicum JI]|uniref:NAD(P)/FAD-dependent oxidoreductase n=1 Tax=Pelotomaculum isophthalicicum JI TaxID=947010 RepID=A0A9X4H5I3_9FIRM|nr:NAD(P)/FAD-dependent oxidoreductase [Pelotomaculum isophthalicicum]MDF9408492.1 NAD(P)/FAD-dependent oxidoreductase [Pelotomaculum isophthalicicum JI]
MSDNLMARVVVIGGGAAGIMAAIAARHAGADVTIMEKNQRVGKKILATGNGRCNLTNVGLEITNYHGNNPEFASEALSRFNVQKTIDFFEYLGVTHKVEDGGKVFPRSDQASSVLDVMRYELDETGVEVICEAEVKEVKKNAREFVINLADGRVFRADRVIVATGGKAAPQLGSNGSGYDLAKKFGHKIVEPFPALVQLKLAAKFLKQVKGIKFEGYAEIIVNKMPVAGAQGEILFTEYGISGPPILSLSRIAGEYAQKKQKVHLGLNLINYFSGQKLEEYLTRRFQTRPEKPLAFSFVGFINKRLAPVVLREAGIADANKPAGQVAAGELKNIIRILKDWRFEITGTTSWPNAQVTAGGVDVAEVNAQTMESKIVPGLYFAGEVLDIDGDCGGFNLQWAWSSGHVAGKSAAAGR